MTPTSSKLEMYPKLQEHHQSEMPVQAFMLSYFYLEAKIVKLILERFFNFILSTEKALFKLNRQYFLFIFTLFLLLNNSLVSIHHNIPCRAAIAKSQL